MQAILVRHGRAKSNENPLEGTVGQYASLTEVGRRQDEATAAFLADIVTTRMVYTSPLRRARQTADILAGRLALEVIEEERLKEIYKGIWQGLPVRKVVELEAAVNIDKRPIHRPPGGENWLDVGRRVASVIEEHRLAGHEQSLLVSHDHSIRMGIGVLVGLPLSQWEDIPVDNASVTAINYARGRWTLDPELYNITPLRSDE